MRRPIARDQNQRKRVPGSLVANWVNFWNPAELSPDLWLDATDASTITESSGSVSQWASKDGGNKLFTQGTASAQPATGTTTFNGLNVIKFDGNDRLGSTAASSVWNFLHDGTKYVFAAVWQPGSADNPETALTLMNTRSFGANRGASIRYDDSGATEDVFVYNVHNGSSTVAQSVVSTIPASGQYVWSAVVDPNNGTAVDRIQNFVNGREVAKTNTATASVSASNPEFTLHIGATSTGALFMTGWIGEIITVSGVNATEATRRKLHTYLNNKWGVF